MEMAERLLGLGLVPGTLALKKALPRAWRTAAGKWKRRGKGTPHLLLECCQAVLKRTLFFGISPSPSYPVSIPTMARPHRFRTSNLKLTTGFANNKPSKPRSFVPHPAVVPLIHRLITPTASATSRRNSDPPSSNMAKCKPGEPSKLLSPALPHTDRHHPPAASPQPKR